MIVFILSTVAAVLGCLAFLAGIFDRPKFIYREFLGGVKKGTFYTHGTVQ
jgi:hypothetical protein